MIIVIVDSERRASNENSNDLENIFCLLLEKLYFIFSTFWGKKQHIFSKFSEYELYFQNLFKIVHNLGYTTKTHHLTISPFLL